MNMAQYYGRLYIKVKNHDIWDELNNIKISQYGIYGNFNYLVPTDCN